MKTRAGGAIGLALLAFAFAYRWMGPEGLGLEPTPDAPPVVDAGLGPTIPETPPATPLRRRAAPVERESQEPAAPSLADLSAEVRADVDDALARGDAARAAGHFTVPQNDNALYWYEAALEVDPKNAAATEARRALIENLIEEANVALDAGDPAAANDLMPSLAEREDFKADRAALKERIENLPRVQFLLREAAQRMALGQRFEPERESALASYRAVVELDPRNLAAQQGLARIEAIVLQQALAAASEDKFADADRLLALASSILVGTQAQLATRTRIVELRRQRTDALLSRAEAALDARNSDSAAGFLARAEALGADAAILEPLRERIANARLYAHRQPGDVFSDPFLDRAGSGPEVVVVPVGRFTMGAPERERGRKAHEGPPHEVAIGRPFALARTETTVAQFRRFISATGYRTDAEQKGTSTVYEESTGRMAARAQVDWRFDYAGQPADDDEPVLHVSWNDAAAFSAWLAERTGHRYRLPSEAEFEYALRAGTTTRYPWGDANPLRVVGNFTGDGDRSRTGRAWTKAFPRYADGYYGPSPVAKFTANEFGVFDLAGNVSEWVDDCWHDSYLRAPTDGSSWVNPGCSRRVVRGGAWGSAPEQTRSAFRLNATPDTRSARVGFRVARDL